MVKGQESHPRMDAPPYPGPPLSTNYGFMHPPPTAQQPMSQYVPQQPYTVQPVNLVVQDLPMDYPGRMRCPDCRRIVLTEVSYINGACTWLTCFLIGFFLCWPCCCIPFCSKGLKDVEHSCPQCQKVLHRYKRGM
ncbi:LITAF domain-containing protein-like [Notolabrus celidotus]|uniref:LITAF domain-containing protein-like n=1 Tax=Notolabrus celidotus TaxID=1203425 RepID=UPI00148FAAF5|nr:LITAF domain-containing protein-like [Notolabrus celidotus]XP_034544389.1 LITAF domain-containing protein-like [Notolabrus celidotus]